MEQTETQRAGELRRELGLLARDGLKNNPLRLEYEQAVRDLDLLRQTLEREGRSRHEIARTLHQRRRQLGKEYKQAAPPLLRDYIYYATANKYGDPLGPDYDALRHTKSDEEIISSACRPIRDLNDRLSIEGFQTWYTQTYGDKSPETEA